MTRNELSLLGAAVQRGPPGLLPAARARSLRSQPACYATGTSWPQEGPTPHDSMTSGADLVEEIVNCKRSRSRSPPIKPQCGPSATNGAPCRSPSVDGKVRQLPQATRPSTCCSGNGRCRIDRRPCGEITSVIPSFTPISPEEGAARGAPHHRPPQDRASASAPLRARPGNPRP